jgi:hypothetical protein
MKFCFARAFPAVLVAASLAGVSSAQTTTPPFPVAPQNPTPKKPPQVIFSRSTDAEGNTTTTVTPAAHPGAQPSKIATAQDAEREAVTYVSYDMDVHLRPADHEIAVRALVVVRNDGQAPLAHIPVQISSSLNWERCRVEGADVTFPVSLINSDADHTGQLREAAIPLATPLAPGGTLNLDLTYSGVIEPNSQRLIAIGTPEDSALHSDWDTIDSDFTGLRGFGNVGWYPVSSVPVLLGDGARLFDEMGEHKLRLAGAEFRLRLSVEFLHGQAPTVALINGHPAALAVTDADSEEVAGVATAQADRAILGFEAPSLFVAMRNAHAGDNLTAWTTPENDVNVQLWIDAATKVAPFLQGWLGHLPRAKLTLLDLPDRQDAPFETGALLVTALHEALPGQLEGAMAHALTHAWMQSPRAWLSEGVAHFMGTLWIENQQGRERALTALEAGRNGLTLAEPESPGQSPGQPLALATAPVYYRTKAAYVLWMLRDVAGDATLSAALRAYDPARDLGAQTVPSLFEQLLEQAGPRHDMKWFFADWVDTDKGLPSFSVGSVFPTAAEAGNWLVAVTVSNSGYATAEVPVTVRNAETSITQRVRVPARGSATQRILILGRPTEVQVNDGTVPETEASEHLMKLDQGAAKP